MGEQTIVCGTIRSATCFVKYYWNTDTPISLHVVYGGFLATMTELSNHDRDCVYRAKDIYYLDLYRKGLPNPGLRQSSEMRKMKVLIIFLPLQTMLFLQWLHAA